jgi:hypothetical protein
MRGTPSAGLVRLLVPAVLVAAVVAACSDQTPTGITPPVSLDPAAPRAAVAAFDCSASTSARTVSCRPSGGLDGAIRAAITGGQGTNIQLTSSNVSYNSGTEIFQFDVTVQNLMNEALGTPDGTVADPQGIQVFFHQGPTTTGGTGTVTVANADGSDAFTGTNQPFFAYPQILVKNQVSNLRTWQLNVPTTVTSFNFTLLVESDLQYLLVINEVMANPANFITNPDTSAEWFEVYNAGSRKVHMQGLVIADSAPSGRQPYHLISSALDIAPGAYVVLGRRTNTTTNGGVPVDYAYGTALALANSLDAVKIARVFGTDTLTIDRTQYSNAAVSAADGISRELKNPALDNSNMDGSNWAGALATAVYGPGGRGTPKAQNSTFTP